MAKALSKPSFNDFNFKPNFSMHEIKLLENDRTPNKILILGEVG